MSVMNTNQAPPVHGGDIHVTGGSIAVTRLYDVAYAIDLDRVEHDLTDAAIRLRLVRASPQSVAFASPPVDIALGRTSLALQSGAVDLSVRARVYDFGAVRLSYELPVASMPWTRYADLVNEVEAALESGGPWQADRDRVRDLLAAALDRPSHSPLEEDYLFATVRGFDPPLAGEEVVARLDLVPLLTGGRRPISADARRDVLRHAYSYYTDDLVVISWARALIVEPAGEGEADVADILGVAHAQLLELRYYNERLDAELPRMYDRVEETRSRFGALARRRYARLARSLHSLLAEVTEVSERIENALVVTDDVYLARVYEAALDQHRVRDWSVAVDRKLGIIRDTYTALYDEATAARAEYLEITIVLLIALEIILAFVL